MIRRTFKSVIPARHECDGNGVRIARSLGASSALRADPFLLLEEFSADREGDRAVAAPLHPHCGFDTLTYVLAGLVRHRDHLGRRSDLHSGDLQHMSAGSGILHAKTPVAVAGALRGFQIWINVAHARKRQRPHVSDIAAIDIPELLLSGGRAVRVLAGSVHIEGHAVTGALTPSTGDLLFLDIELPPLSHLRQDLRADDQALLYIYDGSVGVDDGQAPLHASETGVLSPGAELQMTAGEAGARMLLLAAPPLREPVVQYGTFILNSVAEVEAALADYRNGRLTLRSDCRNGI